MANVASSAGSRSLAFEISPREFFTREMDMLRDRNLFVCLHCPAELGSRSFVTLYDDPPSRQRLFCLDRTDGMCIRRGDDGGPVALHRRSRRTNGQNECQRGGYG